jgi:hypothetical protein
VVVWSGRVMSNKLVVFYMNVRYSVLRPLTFQELEKFALEIINFFSPLNYAKNCDVLGIKQKPNSIVPFSFNSFLQYLELKTIYDPHKYKNHIDLIIQKFLSKGLLIHAGYETGSPQLFNCYYSIIELTNCQRSNLFWLGETLGESYLVEKYKPYIIRIEGQNSGGISGTGSGILINSDTVLTCRHNLVDLISYSCYLGDSKLTISRQVYHDIHDIGLIKLHSPVIYPTYPYFGQPYILDSTLTLGYPPLRGMREASLVSQKGEINALSKDWWNSDCITISSAVRPGNSGGPVISLKGYVVGIVTQFANSADSVSADKQGFKDSHATPFYNAISSTSIVDIIKEIDNSFDVVFEDYQ